MKEKDTTELAKWLNYHFHEAYAPWDDWWETNFCSKCETEIVTCVDSGREMSLAWCELCGKCKFFQELDKVPDSKQVIKLWLESEVKGTNE